MVKFLRHRCNSLEDLREWLPLYDGVECDVRLNDSSKATVEHHPGEHLYPFDLADWLALADQIAVGRDVTYAINIKSNGLVPELRVALLDCDNYFLFDVPGEEIEEYRAAGLRVFARWSEYDYQQDFLGDLNGGVIDCFKGDYSMFPELLDDLKFGTEIAAIGEDLRGRPPLSIKQLELLGVQYLITKSRL